MNILHVDHLSDSLLHSIFEEAFLFQSLGRQHRCLRGGIDMHELEGKIMATLFFEPSTRTRLSFEAAWSLLGGKVISVADKESTSIKKGESIAETIGVVSEYSDVLVVRSEKDCGSWLDVSRFREFNPIIINAGDGGNNHPTQAMLDAYTIWKQYEGPDKLKTFYKPGLKYLLIGDLRHSRTIKSFLQLMTRDGSAEFFVYDSTGMGRVCDNELGESRAKIIRYYSEVEPLMSKVDVVYLNRVQRERSGISDDSFEHFQLMERHLAAMKVTTIVLDPGPVCEEIT